MIFNWSSWFPVGDYSTVSTSTLVNTLWLGLNFFQIKPWIDAPPPPICFGWPKLLDIKCGHEVWYKFAFSLLHIFFFRGLVPLHNACSYGHYEVAELLVKVMQRHLHYANKLNGSDHVFVTLFEVSSPRNAINYF